MNYLLILVSLVFTTSAFATFSPNEKISSEKAKLLSTFPRLLSPVKTTDWKVIRECLDDIKTLGERQKYSPDQMNLKFNNGGKTEESSTWDMQRMVVKHKIVDGKFVEEESIWLGFNDGKFMQCPDKVSDKFTRSRGNTPNMYKVIFTDEKTKDFAHATMSASAGSVNGSPIDQFCDEKNTECPDHEKIKGEPKNISCNRVSEKGFGPTAAADKENPTVDTQTAQNLLADIHYRLQRIVNGEEPYGNFINLRNNCLKIPELERSVTSTMCYGLSATEIEYNGIKGCESTIADKEGDKPAPRRPGQRPEKPRQKPTAK